MNDTTKIAIGAVVGSFAAPYVANFVKIDDTPGPGLYEALVAVVVIASILAVKGF